MIRGGMSNDSEKGLFLEHLQGFRAEAGKIQKYRIMEMRRIIIIGSCVSMLPGRARMAKTLTTCYIKIIIAA